MAGLGPAINAIANRGSVGAPPPPANESIAPPSYDVAHDPGWKGLVDPHNHPLRNLLNQLSPEEREVLRAWKSGGAPTAQAERTLASWPRLARRSSNPLGGGGIPPMPPQPGR